MAVLSEIVVVDYRVALFALMVIFLILFLLYRERRQQPSVTIAGDVNISPTYHFPQKAPSVGDPVSEKPNKPKKADDGKDGEKAKSEPPHKIAEEPSFNDKEARKSVRRRKTRPRTSADNQSSISRRELTTPRTTDQNVPRPERVEESERVFSRTVIRASRTVEEEPADAEKAFLDQTATTSEKERDTLPKVELEMEQFNSNMSLPDEGKNRRQSTTINESHSQNEALITPYVEFKSHNGKQPKFSKDVTLALYTGYAAVDDGSNPAGDAKRGVPVKVMYKRSSSSPFEFVKDAFLQQDKFISFTCRHFCGYCVAAEQSRFHSMRRRYYYAGYVRESVAATRVFHWMLFEDCPAAYEQKVDYLNSGDKSIVIDPESFYIRYDYTLQMVVKTGVEVSPGQHDRENVQLGIHWGSRVDHSEQFEITKICDRSNANLRVEYKMFAIHNRNGPHLPVKEKHFYYEWKEPPPPSDPVRQGDTINVFGERATGVRNIYPTSYPAAETQPVQHQESVESNRSGYSSGYGSPPPSTENRSFEGSFNGSNQSASPSAIRQDSGFNDVEEAATRPKRATKPKIPSTIHSPRRHSTPRHSPLSPEVDSHASDLPRRTPNTSSEVDPITAESLQPHDSGVGEFSSMLENSVGTEVDPVTPDLSVHSLNVPSLGEDEVSAEPPLSDSTPPDSLEPERLLNARSVPSSDSKSLQNENGGVFPENQP